jgi:hypothetical protein
MIRVRRFFFTFTFPFTNPPSKSGALQLSLNGTNRLQTLFPRYETVAEQSTPFQLDHAAGKMKAGNQQFLHL